MATLQCRHCDKQVEYQVELCPSGPHYGRRVCVQCACFIGWEPTPDDKKKRRRSNISAGLRTKIFERDEYRCTYCRRLGSQLEVSEYLHVDHVIPESKGGKTEPENLTTACSTCNMGKSDNETTCVTAGV